MAFNLEESQRLSNASFMTLYQNHKKEWDSKASEAYQYTRGYISKDIPVRPDDVVKTLVPAVTVSQTFIDHIHEKKLRERYWATWFSDYILDCCWSSLKGGK